MNETSEHNQPSKRVTIGYLLLFLLFLILAFLLWQWWHIGQDRLLKPAILLETPNAAGIDGHPIQVSFADLQEMPTSFQGFRIQVTGNFTRIAPPDCSSFNGPFIQWGLINDELQMNGIGMEPVLHLVPEGTMLTVEGIWRLYRGPVGCGKEPETMPVWYLSIERILQPNPLPAFGTPFALTPLPSEGGTVIPAETAVSPIDPSDPSTTATVLPNTTAVATPTRLPTIGVIEATATETETPVLGSTSTPTSVGTAVSTLTPPPNSTATVTATASSTPTIDPAATPTSGSNLPPPASTATPQDGYLPPPTSSPVPTSISYP